MDPIAELRERVSMISAAIDSAWEFLEYNVEDEEVIYAADNSLQRMGAECDALYRQLGSMTRSARARLAAIYDDFEDEDEYRAEMQRLINSGDAWRLEGSVGRAAMAMIEEGSCILGEEGHRDYWGNYVPSRYEVEAGTKGSVEYAESMGFQPIL